MPHALIVGAKTSSGRSTIDLMGEASPPNTCILIALASDNSGYDLDASPAPKPKKVFKQLGTGCS